MQKDHFIDELLAKTELVKLVGEYVRLERRGAAYWGCCPFHHEKTPSFMITPEKQLYYCHGACHEGGNAITFIKKIESVSGADAIAILAKKAGMEVPQSGFGKKNDAATIQKKERLAGMMRLAARRYHENLTSSKAEEARAYLKNRGIAEALWVRFGLGYSVNGQDMIEYLASKGYTAPEMKEANLAYISGKGAHDPFCERLMVPIINQFGDVVAFGGRTLAKNPDFAKYKNSAEGILFDKGKVVYGANLLQKYKAKNKIESVILCEGYMDVISLHNAGFETAVASMGTSLTHNQAKQIKNFATKVFVSYDGDAAGQKATLRSLDILAEAGLSVRVVRLPDGCDPDDVIQKQGDAAYQKLLNEAVPLPAFKIETLKSQFDITDPEGKSKFAVAAVRIIKSLDNPVEQEEYLSLVRLLTGYSIDALRRQAELSEQSPPIFHSAQELSANLNHGEKDPVTDAKKFVLACLAANKSFIDYTEDFSTIFTDEFSKTVAEYLLTNRKEKSETIGLLYEMIDEELKPELDGILHYEFITGDNEKKYCECMTGLKIHALQSERESLMNEYNETRDRTLLSRIGEIPKIIQHMKNGGEF